MDKRIDQHRLPDLNNLPKPRWRDAVRALLGPANRLHRYRDLHRRMFYDATCRLDCGDRS